MSGNFGTERGPAQCNQTAVTVLSLAELAIHTHGTATSQLTQWWGLSKEHALYTRIQFNGQD